MDANIFMQELKLISLSKMDSKYKHKAWDE